MFGAHSNDGFTKRLEWTRSEISAVRADASGMEVNDRPVIELQIHPMSGKKAGSFAGRVHDELCWRATELGRTLQVLAQEGLTSSARRTIPTCGLVSRLAFSRPP